MMERNLRQVWDQLRAQNATRQDRLVAVTIQGMRGIRDVTVRFPYPVCALAGANACGKSTVLYALACAYRPPGAGLRDFVPSALFPDFRTKQADLPGDRPHREVSLAYEYVIGGATRAMRWRRKHKSWNRSGLPGKQVPQRGLYLRTLANLSNPAEVRSLLQLGRRNLEKETLSAAEITLAHRVLPWNYVDVLKLKSTRRELLFVTRDGQVSYSEFHMSSGERSVLRLSLDLGSLRDSLVLIDEVEAGLHPFSQQMLMLEMQRLALRNHLQVVVATHSPVILDSVPPEGRIFLERQGDEMTVQPAFHDTIQRAFYGRALDRLSVVCEDTSAEAVVRGVFEVLFPRLSLLQEDVQIGRDTGKAEFKHHVAAFGRFKQLWSTLFVLDGDGRNLVPELKATADRQGQNLNIVCLPGDGPPEQWAWTAIVSDTDGYAEALGLAPNELRARMQAIHQSYEGAADSEANKAKGRIATLAQATGRDVPALLRAIGRREAERPGSSLAESIASIQDAVATWRHARGAM